MVTGGQAALWLTVIAFGVFHGLNPAMGWPLAVANGLSARRDAAVFGTLGPLGAGHLLAMAVAVLPVALLSELVRHSQVIRIGAGALVLLFGIYKLTNRRHPRMLARIRPAQLAWWSFVMATAHGAGLMLIPVALGLCATRPSTTSMIVVSVKWVPLAASPLTPTAVKTACSAVWLPIAAWIRCTSSTQKWKT